MKKLPCIFFLLLCCTITVQAQSNIITTIAGKDTAGYCCDGELATIAKLNFPESLWFDKLGNIYIADAFNQRIRKINNSSGIISTIAGNGVGGYSGDSGLATNAELFLPEAIIVDTVGNIYIADAENSRIRKIDATTNIITTFAGNGIVGSTGDNGIATNAELNKPSGLSFDKSWNILIADHNNNKIRKVNITTGIITTIAGSGLSGYTGDNGLAINAELNGPGQIFVDSSDDIIFSDSYNNVIRKIDISTGIITTIAGTGALGYIGNGGPATNAEFDEPIGLYIDQQQNIFIADVGNGAIRKIDGSTGIITTVAGDGTQGYSGNGGPATNAQITPDDVYFNSSGDMFIADAGNNCIRKVQSGLAVHNVIQEDVVKIYPNPTTGAFVIETNANNNQRSVEILDVVGNKVYESILNNTQTEIDISAQPVGIYMLHITNPTTGEHQIRKIVKE